MQEKPTTSHGGKESEKHYRRLVENARDVFFRLDPEGRITLLNKAFTTITGWPTDDWIGLPFPPLIHESDLPLAMEKFRQALQGISGDIFELRVRRKDGGFITGEFVIASHEETSPSTSVFGIARDVTERKRLENQLHHSQKMESLGSLAGGIAHDFNNLIGIIVGYCELATDSMEAEHPARNYLAQIDAAGQRASSLVQQILTFARKKPVSLKPLQFNDTIVSIVSMLRETLPKTVEIRVELDPTVPRVQADSSQISQILMNLCLNARDAMDSAGTITLSTRLTPGGETPANIHNSGNTPYVLLSVSDTGAGMTEEVLGSIFEPFFTTKKRGSGSGLGLAVVHGIVTSHHGHIEVSSKPDAGTRFDLYFPVSKESGAEMPRTNVREDSADGRGETILVVEDEPNILQMTSLSLRRKGYHVITASDGAEALSVYEESKNEISLIFLDLGLPKIDGAEVAERIKGSNPDAKIILASGYLERDQQGKLKTNAADDFMQKPYELKDMLRRIQTVIRGAAKPGTDSLPAGKP
jgi:PAS domain S-box-containing protein